MSTQPAIPEENPIACDETVPEVEHQQADNRRCRTLKSFICDVLIALFVILTVATIIVFFGHVLFGSFPKWNFLIRTPSSVDQNTCSSIPSPVQTCDYSDEANCPFDGRSNLDPTTVSPTTSTTEMTTLPIASTTSTTKTTTPPTTPLTKTNTPPTTPTTETTTPTTTIETTTPLITTEVSTPSVTTKVSETSVEVTPPQEQTNWDECKSYMTTSSPSSTTEPSTSSNMRDNDNKECEYRCPLHDSKGVPVCISQAAVCDGFFNCPGATDEKNCPQSKLDGRRYHHSMRCPSEECPDKFHCLSFQEEKSCPPTVCKSDQFRCLNGRECIPSTYVCDGLNHCVDKSDEANCPPADDRDMKTVSPAMISTTESKYKESRRASRDENGWYHCLNGCDGSIPPTFICDGYYDCEDGSDEVDCKPAECEENEFRCGHGFKCIPEEYVCNGESNCRDCTDESTCYQGETASWSSFFISRYCGCSYLKSI